MTINLTLPTLHSNGTSKERLIDALCDARNALDAAYKALKLTAPNGRDYYPQGPDALIAAVADHSRRMIMVDTVIRELDDLTIAIDQSSPQPPKVTT